MPKGRKRPRGTTIGEIAREMDDIQSGVNFSAISRLSAQPQNNMISKSQERSNAQSQYYIPSESQTIHKSLSQAQNHPGSLKRKFPVKKKGRGPAKLPDMWDSGIKIQVNLNEEGQLIGEADQYNKYTSALGALARIGTLLPLNYLSWSYMPKDKLDTVWKDVQDNTTLPPEAKSIVLHTLNDMWRDWKRRLKAEYFTPYKDDPDYDFSQQPNEQVEMDQWLDLVQYWRKKEVQDLAKQNAGNRARKKYLHRTGKKPFQRLKQEMKADGKNITKLDVFVESRTCGKRVNVDLETIDLIRGFEEELSKKPELEQTNELKDDLFVNAFGEDKHGRGRCTGRGIINNKLNNTFSSSLKMSENEIVGQVEELRKLKDELTHEKKEIEQMKLELCNQKEELDKDKERVVNEVRAELKHELDHMKVNMDFFMSLIDPTTIQEALSRGPEHSLQVTNVLGSTHGSQIDSDENAQQKQHQAHSILNISKSAGLVVGKSRRENDLYDCGSVQVGNDVILHSSEIPKEAVAEGVVLSIDPYEKVDNFALGIEFVKVAIKKAIKPNYLLLRPRRGLTTIGEAVGKSVAWEFVNVMEK